MCPLEQYGWLTDSRGPLIRGTGAVAIFRRAVQPRLCHRRAAQLTALSTVSLVPARRLVGNWGFCASLMSQWTCNAWICHPRFSWRWSCMIFVMLYVLSCSIHFWGLPGRCSILSHPRYPAFFPTIGADRLGQQAQVWSSRERLWARIQLHSGTSLSGHHTESSVILVWLKLIQN